MTKARQAALTILRSATEPLSATAVHKQIGNCCDPVTVYRTLHYLEEHDYASSFVLHCSEHGTERYYTAINIPGADSKPHHHWFHCESCHRFLDLGDCQLHDLVADHEKTHGIKVNSHTLYFTGICSDCLND